MSDARCLDGQLFCQIRIIACNISPAVNEDLSANLFSDHPAVGFYASALRSTDPVFEIFIGGMFTRYADPAPPEKTGILFKIIQKSIADVFGFYIILLKQSSNEKQWTIGVIVGSEDPVINRIAIHCRIFLFDFFVGPSLNRCTEPDADILAQPRCICLFQIFPVIFFAQFSITHLRYSRYSSFVNEGLNSLMILSTYSWCWLR